MRRNTRHTPPAPMTQLLGADNIDTQGRIGDVIRIDPYTLAGSPLQTLAPHQIQKETGDHTRRAC